MQINRYFLKITDYQTITIPSGYHVLSAAPGRDTYKRPSGYPGGNVPVQGIDLWVKVNDSEPQIGFGLGVYLIGTGNPLPTKKSGSYVGLNFIDTCVMENKLVWHVFVGPVQNELED